MDCPYKKDTHGFFKKTQDKALQKGAKKEDAQFGTSQIKVIPKVFTLKKKSYIILHILTVLEATK